ncbi:MAG: SGNH/GDSL hydrolase family protein [Candidatus Hydrogenedentota bacterium]
MKPLSHQDYPYVGHDFVLSVDTNSYGFRDDEFSIAEDSTKVRIALLGDSYLFGHGVTVAERLDTHLARVLEREGLSAEVMNCGVPGWGTRTEILFALDHLEELRPDIVVLVFCGNDPSNDRGDVIPRFSDPDHPLYGLKRFVRNHSHVYRLGLKYRTTTRHRRGARAELAKHGTANFDAQTASVITDEDWERTLGMIRAFHEDFLAFNPKGQMAVLATAPDNDGIGRQLASLTNGMDLRYLDIKEAFTAITPEERRTPWDSHWGPKVHEIAGRAIAAWILEHHGE